MTIEIEVRPTMTVATINGKLYRVRSRKNGLLNLIPFDETDYHWKELARRRMQRNTTFDKTPY